MFQLSLSRDNIDLICNSKTGQWKVIHVIGLPIEDLKTIYIGFIRPFAKYAIPTWHPGLSEHQQYALERIQKRACRITLEIKSDSYINDLEQGKLTNHRTRWEQT